MDLQQEFTKVTRDVETLERNIREVKRDVDTAKKREENKQREMSALTKQREELEKKLSEYEIRLRNYRDNLEAMGREIDKKKGEWEKAA